MLLVCQFEIKNSVRLLVLRGRLDTATVPEFTREVEAALANPGRHLVLDCTELTYVSSSGMRGILGDQASALTAA
jgi:anti-anti-sigma factor